MNNKTLKISVIGLMAALAYISFTFLQIKIPTIGGTTSFHLGNTFVVLAALLLGGVPGGIAGAIGMGIGDLLDPVYVTYAPKTIVLKLMIGIVTGFVAHKIFKVKNLEGRQLYIAVVVSAIAGLAFNVVGEPLFGYFYNSVILGASEAAAKTLAGWNAITTTTNAIIGVIISSILYIAIQPRLKNHHIIEKLAPRY